MIQLNIKNAGLREGELEKMKPIVGAAYETLMQRMKSAGGKLLEGAELFDVYRDEQRLGAGKKSMAYNLTYRAADRTLTGEEVEKAHAKLVKKVCGSTGAEVRG